MSHAAAIDREHAIQTGLIDALCQAAEQGETARAGEILAQLVAYSSAHFLSEELLMRLASYADYEDHVADHIRMMDELNGLLALRGPEASRDIPDKARAVREFLVRHIETRDARFLQG